MNYDSTKLKFEQIVKRMQADLAEYANKKTSSQASIDYRLRQINDLVDFYTLTNELISQEQMGAMALQLNWSRLHSDTRKLVLFTKLHNINPNIVFLYTYEELEEIYKMGVRFCPPAIPWDRAIFKFKGNGSVEITERPHSIDDFEIIRKYGDKYHQANMLTCRKNRSSMESQYFNLKAMVSDAK